MNHKKIMIENIMLEKMSEDEFAITFLNQERKPQTIVIGPKEALEVSQALIGWATESLFE